MWTIYQIELQQLSIPNTAIIAAAMISIFGIVLIAAAMVSIFGIILIAAAMTHRHENSAMLPTRTCMKIHSVSQVTYPLIETKISYNQSQVTPLCKLNEMGQYLQIMLITTCLYKSHYKTWFFMSNWFQPEAHKSNMGHRPGVGNVVSKREPKGSCHVAISVMVLCVVGFVKLKFNYDSMTDDCYCSLYSSVRQLSLGASWNDCCLCY